MGKHLKLNADLDAKVGSAFEKLPGAPGFVLVED